MAVKGYLSRETKGPKHRCMTRGNVTEAMRGENAITVYSPQVCCFRMGRENTSSRLLILVYFL